MDHTTTNAPARVPLGKLAFGIALLAGGILIFTDYMDVFDVPELWRFWPVFLIFLGVSTEIDSLRQREAGSGYILIAIGTWLLIASHRFLGLTHRTAFPVAIAIAGLGVIIHALVDDPATQNKEKKS